MLNVSNIKDLLTKMTEDVNSNLKKIRKAFGSLDYTDDDNQSLLHIFVDNKYNEAKCLLAIKSLLKIGLSPNLEDDFNYNFIQTALYAGYSENFILSIISESLKYNLEVNHVDSDKDTIVHTAIYSDDYLGEVERIYELLCANGFDSSKLDHDGRNLIEAMIFQKQYSDSQIDRFKKLFNANLDEKEQVKPIAKENKSIEVTPPTIVQTLSEKEISDLEKYGKVLNKKNYVVSPTIGREKELKNLMITLAQNKKRPLIVGESGVGKTALVEELVYRIKTGQVPKFLQGKIILEINPSEVVAGCQYVGQFEEKMTKLMNLCERYDVIVFIDEIHTIYGVGSTKSKDSDMASILKYYIDRTNLKVIGTTTEKEYDEFFSNDPLKRRFEKIKVQEPTDEILYQIIDKVISDYYITTGILFENDNIKNQIVSVILEATAKSHRVYNDMVNNPDLSISIIDKAFAFAQVYDSEFITSEHFVESFEYCDRIYETSRNGAITKLRNLDESISKPTAKILKLDFNKR